MKRWKEVTDQVAIGSMPNGILHIGYKRGQVNYFS